MKFIALFLIASVVAYIAFAPESEPNVTDLLEARRIAHDVALANLCGLALSPEYEREANRKMRAGMRGNLDEEKRVIALQKSGDWDGWSKATRKQRCNALRV